MSIFYCEKCYIWGKTLLFNVTIFFGHHGHHIAHWSTESKLFLPTVFLVERKARIATSELRGYTLNLITLNNKYWVEFLHLQYHILRSLLSNPYWSILMRLRKVWIYVSAHVWNLGTSLPPINIVCISLYGSLFESKICIWSYININCRSAIGNTDIQWDVPKVK